MILVVQIAYTNCILSIYYYIIIYIFYNYCVCELYFLKNVHKNQTGMYLVATNKFLAYKLLSHHDESL